MTYYSSSCHGHERLFQIHDIWRSFTLRHMLHQTFSFSKHPHAHLFTSVYTDTWIFQLSTRGRKFNSLSCTEERQTEVSAFGHQINSRFSALGEPERKATMCVFTHQSLK